MKSSLKRLVTGLSAIGLGFSVALPSMAQSQMNSAPNAETTPANTPQTTPPSNRDTGVPPVNGQSGQNTPGSMSSPSDSNNSAPTTNSPGLPNNQSVPGSVSPANRPENNNTPSGTTPSGNSSTTTPSYSMSGSENQSIDQIVRTSPSFELFNALLRVADSNGTFSQLAGDSNYTVFAPTDEALAAIPPATFKTLVQPENRALLIQVLENHIVKGKVSSADLTAKEVRSLSGNALAPQGGSGSLTIGNAQVVGPDIQASNGIIHAVNQPIIPADLQTKLTSLAPQASTLPATQPTR
ncbi:MAG: hypothetical protein C4287_18950 [Leptolyngbya sp. ERB_1_2]